MADKQITGLPSTSGVELADILMTNKGGVDYKATLEELTTASLEKGVAVFDTVVAMKAESLSSGQVVVTRGSGSVDDGLWQIYLVQTSANYGGTPDETNDHTLTNGNIAKSITKSLIVTSSALADPLDTSQGDVVSISSTGTINDLSNGWKGKEITIINESGGTVTLNQSGTMAIDGSSYAMPDNATITLIYTGTKWFEKCRSDNS